MHRDIKPDNIMINHKTKDLKIIDWGVSEFFFMNRDYTLKSGTSEHRPPEMVMGIQAYDYAVDMWSLGVVFAGMIFKHTPFFEEGENIGMMK
jgi:casein kinase II subunit alpha